MFWYKKNKENNNNVNKTPKNSQVDIVKFEWKDFFTNFQNNYQIDVIKSTINRIATDIAQVSVNTYRQNEKIKKSNFDYLLNLRPNNLMSSYDFYYKIITNLFLQGNVFIKIEKDINDKIISLIPIEYSSIELLSKDDELFIRFYQNNNAFEILPYSQIIHLRKFYNKNFLGDNPNNSLEPSKRILEEMTNSIINNFKETNSLMGIITTNMPLGPTGAPTQFNQERSQMLPVLPVEDINFKNTNFSNKRVAYLSYGQDFKKIDSNISKFSKEQNEYSENLIYKFFNIAPEIVKGTYNSEQFLSYLSTVIHPVLRQLEKEFTFKIFTKKELELGQYFEFVLDSRLIILNLSNSLKGVELGAVNPNEIRKLLFGLDPYEGGDTFLNWNYGKVDKEKNGENKGQQ
ncbi:phage portal protein [Spiroplasma citri]|uniref:Phage portal protein n=1 Tax=Spiroplasma citri TaxID=2133 RepID=A0AAX3SXV1_SPICI|nr:phage portal protein [Spiroplasma citri]WFG96139.1 phage portal protein [Spiroplasma citri]